MNGYDRDGHGMDVAVEHCNDDVIDPVQRGNIKGTHAYDRDTLGIPTIGSSGLCHVVSDGTVMWSIWQGGRDGRDTLAYGGDRGPAQMTWVRDKQIGHEERVRYEPQLKTNDLVDDHRELQGDRDHIERSGFRVRGVRTALHPGDTRLERDRAFDIPTNHRTTRR